LIDELKVIISKSNKANELDLIIKKHNNIEKIIVEEEFKEEIIDLAEEVKEAN